MSEEKTLEEYKELTQSIQTDASKIMFISRAMDMAFPNNNVFRKAMLLAQTDAIRAWVQQVFAEELDLVMSISEGESPEDS